MSSSSMSSSSRSACPSVLFDWRVGKRMGEDIVHHQRAEYGNSTVATLSRVLTRDYGRGYLLQKLTESSASEIMLARV